MSYVIYGPDDVIAFISSLVLLYSVQTEWSTLFFGLLKFSGRVFVYCGFVFVCFLDLSDEILKQTKSLLAC